MSNADTVLHCTTTLLEPVPLPPDEDVKEMCMIYDNLTGVDTQVVYRTH